MKYCGIVTPYRGVRVYTRAAMGMPGSETCLEELLSRVLGELIQEGVVAKLADDLYCGGNSVDDLYHNWTRVLSALQANNLRLSAPKTIVCPHRTNILGWVWSNGTLCASPHRITSLSTVPPPSTVQGLRSFIEAYKVLCRVLKGYADILHPLESEVVKMQSKDKITWSIDLLESFQEAQKRLKDCKTITLPQPADLIWIVTDGAIKARGLGATMYVVRQDKLSLAGFFNAKIKPNQVAWLPCEIEALCIAVAIKHFAPYIVQSHNTVQVLTDNRPCVQAFEKLRRGEFSASSRISTFLSILSRYGVELRHVSGAANLSSDFNSRHPQQCNDESCQICQFVNSVDQSVVRGLSVKDIIDGHIRMPFVSRNAWLQTQKECSDLRRVHAHLTQGTRPSKKPAKTSDVKRYLQKVTIATDSLLVVRVDEPFVPTKEKIVVPRLVVDGLLTALHLKFDHPSSYQLKQIINRYFFALDLDKAISQVATACHVCNSLKSIPDYLRPQSTTDIPNTIGVSYAADIMRRYNQLTFVLRETMTSYTLTRFIKSESSKDLAEALLVLCAEATPYKNTSSVVRVDCAPGFVSLKDSPLLAQNGIQLELGSAKNLNKKSVAEHAIEEVGIEILKSSPAGGPVSPVLLAQATARVNSRIRSNGLSSKEMWTQRDQLTGDQLPIRDRDIILDKISW